MRQHDTSFQTLPPELLRMILKYVGSYREVSKLRAVCRGFDSACSDLLRTVFLELQKNVRRLTRAVELEAERLTRWGRQRVLLRNSLCLYQVHTLAWQLDMLQACTWRYVTAGVCTLFYGKLLDIYCSVVEKLNCTEAGGSRQPVSLSNMAHCRTMTWRFLKQFQYVVEKKLLQSKEDCQNRYHVMLPGTAFIELLETCLNKSRSKPKFQHVHETVQVHVSYVLDGSWLGIQWTEDGNRRLMGHDSFQLCAILRDIIWVSNHEYLISSRYERDNLISGDRMSKYLSVNKPAFYAIEVKGNRVYCYGHKTKSSLSCTSSPRLVINIDLTCDKDALPATLRLEAAPPPAHSAPETLTFNLNIAMESIELMYKWVNPSRYVYSSG